jgi:hypothetical protein
LWISLATIVLQGVLTLGLMVAAKDMGFDQLTQAACAAGALAASLGLSSLLKARLLSRILEQPVNNWRWALVWAAAPAVMVGWIVTRLPEWLELSLGIPAILGVYCYVIWRRGFGPEDRVLFRKQVA